MGNDVFREKSLERIKSPENLDEYIKVANPGVWVLLLGIILILIGACIWGVFGRLESKVKGLGVAKDGVVSCTLDAQQILKIAPDMEVRNGQIEGKVTNIDYNTKTVTAEMNVPDGNCAVEIVVESISPLSFVFN